MGQFWRASKGTTYFESAQFLILRTVLFLGAFLVTLGARRYYRSTFGEVEPQPVYPARELQTLSIFSPAGPTPRLGGLQRVLSPMARAVLIPLGLAVVLFTVFQVTRPVLMIEEDESLAQPPWITLPVLLSQQEAGTWPSPYQSQSTLKAVGGRLMYAHLGSCFVGIWFGRGRRPSQSYYLALGILLLGLSALAPPWGTSIGAGGRCLGSSTFSFPP